MPCTPIAESASRTSSSLKGLMIAVTSFMRVSIGRRSRAARLASEGFADRQDDRGATGVLELREARVTKAIRRLDRIEWAAAFCISADIRRTDDPSAQILGDAEL